MKKCFIIILFLVIFAGCQEEQQAWRDAKRQALVQRFQQVYPETWEKELFKFDLEMMKVQAQNPAPVVIVPPVERKKPYSYTDSPYYKSSEELNRVHKERQMQQQIDEMYRKQQQQEIDARFDKLKKMAQQQAIPINPIQSYPAP